MFNTFRHHDLISWTTTVVESRGDACILSINNENNKIIVAPCPSKKDRSHQFLVVSVSIHNTGLALSNLDWSGIRSWSCSHVCKQRELEELWRTGSYDQRAISLYIIFSSNSWSLGRRRDMIPIPVSCTTFSKFFPALVIRRGPEIVIKISLGSDL